MFRLGKRGRFNLILNLIIILIIMLLACRSIKVEEEEEVPEYESSRDISIIGEELSPLSETEMWYDYECCSNETQISVPTYPSFSYSKDWDEEEVYLLAKIAMCEAEGENIQTKTLVIMTVMNRVESSDFPDSIREVIFESKNDSYQFSPVRSEGRWWTKEPDEECYEAVKVVQESMYDYSDGCLYFESCDNEDNWHSKNLDYLYQSGNIRFYR